MNLLQLLSDIEQVDPEVYERFDSRRRVFKHLGGVGQKLTAAALPLFVGAVFNRAYGQTPVSAVDDVLNFALKLEYLEMYFYQQRTGLTGLSSANQAALTTIATDEARHVQFLRSALGPAAIPDPTAAAFDFSGARLLSSNNTVGPFANWRTNASTYLALAQSFEDLGVRAYKGAAPLTAIMANKTVLSSLLSIHGVEARHSARIRAMRRADPGSSTPAQSVPNTSNLSAQPKSWISGTDNGGASPGTSPSTAPIYGGSSASGTSFLAEDNVVQGGISLSGSTLANTSSFPARAFSEAFDEGLDVSTVSAIARAFTVATSTLFN